MRVALITEKNIKKKVSQSFLKILTRLYKQKKN